MQIAEGVETALSVFELTGILTVAALTDRYMGGLHIPDTVKRIVLAADHGEWGCQTSQAIRDRFGHLAHRHGHRKRVLQNKVNEIIEGRKAE